VTPRACGRACGQSRRADKDLRRTAIIALHPLAARGIVMEAEQLNALANTLADLKDRTAQLRRYL
jgi:hypothetical protein